MKAELYYVYNKYGEYLVSLLAVSIQDAIDEAELHGYDTAFYACPAKERNK
jgi:hypothetical protein